MTWCCYLRWTAHIRSVDGGNKTHARIDKVRSELVGIELPHEDIRDVVDSSRASSAFVSEVSLLDCELSCCCQKKLLWASVRDLFGHATASGRVDS